MANRGCAIDQRQRGILAKIQQVIVNGTWCFETDDVDDSGVLMELRLCLRDLQILRIDQDNVHRHIEAAIRTLIDQIETKIRNRQRHDPFSHIE